MTDEAQRIAIAEFVGIVRHVTEAEYQAAHKEWMAEEEHPHSSLTKPSQIEWKYKCPDYISDLNAIHEAEEWLDHYFVAYIENLKQVTWNSQPHAMEWGDYDGPWDGHAVATARQRCEALLRTIGKWVES